MTYVNDINGRQIQIDILDEKNCVLNFATLSRGIYFYRIVNSSLTIDSGLLSKI